jgi:hypothetical protein
MGGAVGILFVLRDFRRGGVKKTPCRIEHHIIAANYPETSVNFFNHVCIGVGVLL